MTDTLPNISIPANVWVDLYNLSKIAIGGIIAVQNIGNVDIYLSTQELQPSNINDSYSTLQKQTGNWMRSESGDSGAWAYAPNTHGKINIKAV